MTPWLAGLTSGKASMELENSNNIYLVNLKCNVVIQMFQTVLKKVSGQKH